MEAARRGTKEGGETAKKAVQGIKSQKQSGMYVLKGGGGYFFILFFLCRPLGSDSDWLDGKLQAVDGHWELVTGPQQLTQRQSR